MEEAPASTDDCDPRAPIEAFLGAWQQGDIASAMEHVAVPFSSDGGRWMETLAEVEAGYSSEFERHPLSEFTIEPTEAEALSERGREWLEAVEARHQQPIAVFVIRVAIGGDRPMNDTGNFFVALESCRLVGMDD